MINSLEDSHIAQLNQRPINSQLNGRVVKNTYAYPLAQDKSIPQNKSAKISFRGLPSSYLANEEIFTKLIGKTRKFIGGPANHKKVQEIINSAVEILLGNKEIPQELTTYMAEHGEVVRSVIEKAKAFIKEQHKKEPLEHEHLLKEIKKVINTALDVYPTVENPGWLYTSKTLRKFLFMADTSQVVFASLFALVLTGFFRPVTIMVLPGQKNNKDDKKYAAAHSVASGVIGYATSLLVSSPIARAMEKLENHPEKFLTDPAVQYLTKTQAIKAAQKEVNFIPEFILAAPRAVITIALIPPILKHVFGWEKAKHKNKANNPETKPVNTVEKNLDELKEENLIEPQETENVPSKDTQNGTNNTSFTGRPIVNKELLKEAKSPFDRLTTVLACYFARMLENPRIKDLIEKTKTNQNLTRWLSTITSTIISGFYVQQTLTKKDLDEKKRKTLAVNQGLTAIVSNIMAWGLDEKTGKWVDKAFADKYSAVNVNPAINPDHLKAKDLYHGTHVAKTIIIFGMIHRFVVPVLITPIANHIGNKLNEKKTNKN